MSKILIAEDDNTIGITVKVILEKENHTVELVKNGLEAHNRLRTNKYELIILDVRLPEMSGFDICRNYRAHNGQSPVLMLTGLKSIEEKAIGFGSGADDYLTKPFDERELKMRVGALLRRPTSFQDDLIEVRGLELNSRLKLVKLHGELIELRSKEFEMLEYFMKRLDQYFNLKQLKEALWSEEVDVTEDAVRKCLSRMRQKIHSKDDSYISTSKNMGYRFVSQPPNS